MRSSTLPTPNISALVALCRPRLSPAAANRTLSHAFGVLSPSEASHLASFTIQQRLIPEHISDPPPHARALGISTLPLADIVPHLLESSTDTLLRLLLSESNTRPFSADDTTALVSLALTLDHFDHHDPVPVVALGDHAADVLLGAPWPWPLLIARAAPTNAQFMRLLLAAAAHATGLADDPLPRLLDPALTSVTRLTAAMRAIPTASVTTLWDSAISRLVLSNHQADLLLEYLPEFLRLDFLAHSTPFRDLPSLPSASQVTAVLSLGDLPGAMNLWLRLNATGRGQLPHWYWARLLLRVPGLAAFVLSLRPGPVRPSFDRFAAQAIVALNRLSHVSGFAPDAVLGYLTADNTLAEVLTALRILRSAP